MSMKRKNMNACSSRSWEEHAFAEDGRGPLGGFIWPPRSYSCGFCRRDFRSAQALGGHMNVHRKEKAKLKQTVNGTALTAPLSHNHEESVCEECLEPAGLLPSRVSSVPALGDQESLDSSSDVKSCVYDEDLVITRGNGDAEMNLVLGCDMHFCSDTGGKRRKTTTPVIGVDLELRLGHGESYITLRK